MKKKLIKSYAKVNLSLKVLGRNKNKFHKIQSIISYLDIYDRIYINSVNKKKHHVHFDGLFSKNLKNNTITKLLNILEKKNLLKKKYKIQVRKNIPQKSGLGGGSMNAASLLNFFLKNKIISLSNKETINICNQIGSDVFLGLSRKKQYIS